jgi:hypothetical protein
MAVTTNNIKPRPGLERWRDTDSKVAGDLLRYLKSESLLRDKLVGGIGPSYPQLENYGVGWVEPK